MSMIEISKFSKAEKSLWKRLDGYNQEKATDHVFMQLFEAEINGLSIVLFEIDRWTS